MIFKSIQKFTPAMLFMACGLLMGAHSASADNLPYKVDIEGCDFEMAFPSEPFTTRRCHPMMQDRCDLMNSFTKVYDLEATINFYYSCKPIEQAQRVNFTQDAVQIMMVSRPGVSNLETYEMTFDSDNENYSRGALLGAGPSPNGQDVMIYMTQIWVSDKSVLSLEGELIGAQHEEADKIFSEILYSMRYKDDADTEETSEETIEDEDKPAE